MQSETREEVIRNLEEELSETEKIRKKLHNEIMVTFVLFFLQSNYKFKISFY